MTYSSIYGHHNSITILRRYMAEDRMQGGYLFAGPEGIGKKLTAVVTAQALNCPAAAGDPCGRCASCVKIGKGEHPDVRLIAADGDIAIDDVRSLQRGMSMKAYEGRVKVFILDNAHAIGAEAANALLKILEEPPAHSVIILISDKPAALFKTVVSRCRTVKFAAMTRAGLEELLVSVHGMERGQARVLAFFSEGRIGRALALKDSDFIGDKNRVITGFMPGASAEEGLGGERDEVRGYIPILAAWLRDLYLLKTGAGDEDLLNGDRVQDARRYAAAADAGKLYGLFGKLAAAARDLEGNVNTKLLMQALREEFRVVVS